MSTLEIFDFDWTLFRSPHPPPGTSKKTFIHSPESLLPPHVPVLPGLKFWISEVVQEMKSAQRRRDTITALITARRGKTAQRIEDLLYQKGIEPAYFFIRRSDFRKDKDRVHFKRVSVIDILDANPEVHKIVLWEDEQEQINGIKDLCKRRRLEFEGHLVTD